jgi:hypothetical protein
MHEYRTTLTMMRTFALSHPVGGTIEVASAGISFVAGETDLSSKSGYWKVLEEKYDVFFRRMPGVDGLVLTLNECHVPVFRDGLIASDLPAEERVARIARTVARVCARHKKHLILRTFCYFPGEQEKIRQGIERIGEPVTLMMNCQPHDWHVFFPHDPLIASLKDHERVVEYDLALEFMGDGRQPAPQVDYLKYRMDHAAAHGVAGVAGRICRFRNHAEGTLNWESGNADVAREYGLLCDPTPEFIAEVAVRKRTARADIRALRREVNARRKEFTRGDFDHLTTVLERSVVMAEVFTTQHEVEMMVRHDAKRPPRQRRYGAEIAAALARLRRLARTKRRQVLDVSAEGNQYNDVMIEVFCRHAEAYLRGAARGSR